MVKQEIFIKGGEKTMNNYLGQIELTGYKSCRSVTVDLKTVNVLIGGNGAGKSNFLSVFRLMKALFSGNLQLFGMQRNSATLFYNGVKATHTVHLHVKSVDADYGADLGLTDDGRLYLKQESLICGAHTYEATALSESGLRFSTPGDLNETMPCRLIRPDNWQVYHFNDTSRSARIKQEQLLVNCERLQEDGANLASFLYRLQRFYKASYIDIVRVMQQVAPYFDDFVLIPTEGGNGTIQLKWRQKGCEDIFGIAQLSDGTLRFLCLATLLLQPADLQTDVVVIDEPELGLHPYALTLFAEMVRSTAVYHQIIVSTQSVELLNEFNANEVLVADCTDEGTQLRRLDEAELAVWLEEDYSLGDLWKKNLLGGRLSR